MRFFELTEFLSGFAQLFELSHHELVVLGAFEEEGNVEVSVVNG